MDTRTISHAVVSSTQYHIVGHSDDNTHNNEGADGTCGVSDCTVSNGVTWLEGLPRGAYTTCRTVRGGTSVFELSFHLQRLVDSLELMMMADEDSCDGIDALVLKEHVLRTVRDAVKGYQSRHSGDDHDDHEMKITILVPYEKPVCRVYTHVTALGLRKLPGAPVKVEIRGAPRKNAAAKDSDWVTERKKLGKADDVNEIVLEDGGKLYEGLSSNFFAMKGGVLYTAGEGILLGSVREAVLRSAEDLEIPIVLEPPCIDDIEAWDAAFISSTSRMLLPIDSITVCLDSLGDTQYMVKNFDNGKQPLVAALEEAVREDILSSSESIFTSNQES